MTALLKNLLENGLVTHNVTTNLGADVTISALPPDRITVGGDEKPQLNLFLYQVKPKGLDFPSRYGGSGNGAAADSETITVGNVAPAAVTLKAYNSLNQLATSYDEADPVTLKGTFGK